MNQKTKMVITDLDGTLLNDAQEVNKKDTETLHRLKELDIVRVIATGRNYFSVTRVLRSSFPVDYLIFSSGAGILNWHEKRLIYSSYLLKEKVAEIARFFIDHKVDFMIHEVIPNNHKFVYYKSGSHNPDFERRCKIYEEFAEPLNPSTETYDHACQILAVSGKSPEFYNYVLNKIKGVKIIRATSPLDGESVWIEIFPEDVSKGHGVERLCSQLGIHKSQTLGIGNDYNDLDLLEYTKQSFVVDNAPPEIKELFQSCKSNMNCGFTDAVYQALKNNQSS